MDRVYHYPRRGGVQVDDDPLQCRSIPTCGRPRGRPRRAARDGESAHQLGDGPLGPILGDEVVTRASTAHGAGGRGAGDGGAVPCARQRGTVVRRRRRRRAPGDPAADASSCAGERRRSSGRSPRSRRRRHTRALEGGARAIYQSGTRLAGPSRHSVICVATQGEGPPQEEEGPRQLELFRLLASTPVDSQEEGCQGSPPPSDGQLLWQQQLVTTEPQLGRGVRAMERVRTVTPRDAGGPCSQRREGVQEAHRPLDLRDGASRGPHGSLRERGAGRHVRWTRPASCGRSPSCGT